MEKVIDLEDRIPSFRERRKRRTNFKFTLLTTIFIIVLLFLLYLQSSYSKVQKIVVDGHVLEQQQFYIDTSNIVINESIWGFSVKDVEQQLEQLEWVKSVDVKRKLLTTVTITIEEYKKVAYLQEDNTYYPTFENGFIYKDGTNDVPIDAPVFINFQDEGLRKRLLKELPKIDESILALMSQINAVPTENDPYAVTLFMNDGYEIRGDITTLAEKINYYPSIIAQIESTDQAAKGIIDIEVGTFYQSYEKEYGALTIDVGEESMEQPLEDGTPVDSTLSNPDSQSLETAPEEQQQLPTEQSTPETLDGQVEPLDATSEGA